MKISLPIIPYTISTRHQDASLSEPQRQQRQARAEGLIAQNLPPPKLYFKGRIKIQKTVLQRDLENAARTANANPISGRSMPIMQATIEVFNNNMDRWVAEEEEGPVRETRTAVSDHIKGLLRNPENKRWDLSRFAEISGLHDLPFSKFMLESAGIVITYTSNPIMPRVRLDDFRMMMIGEELSSWATQGPHEDSQARTAAAESIRTQLENIRTQLRSGKAMDEIPGSRQVNLPESSPLPEGMADTLRNAGITIHYAALPSTSQGVSKRMPTNWGGRYRADLDKWTERAGKTTNEDDWSEADWGRWEVRSNIARAIRTAFSQAGVKGNLEIDLRGLAGLDQITDAPPFPTEVTTVVVPHDTHADFVKSLRTQGVTVNVSAPHADAEAAPTEHDAPEPGPSQSARVAR